MALTDQDFWDDVWTGELKRTHIPAWHEYYGRWGMFTRIVRRNLGNLKNRDVLEFGGGGGNRRLLAIRKWLGARVHAIDFSPKGIGLLRALFEANGIEIDAYIGDFFEHDFGDRRFDAVVHWGVLEHFEDPTPLLQRCADLLKPDGQILLTMPNMRGPCGYFWQKWSPEDWSKHVFHSTERIQEACETCGLTVVREFHFSYPCLRHSKWERRGTGPSLVSLGQSILRLVATLIPIFHRVGGKSVSMERGFLLRRNSAL